MAVKALEGKKISFYLTVAILLFSLVLCLGGGWSTGIGTQPAYAVFQPTNLKNGSF